MLGHALVATEDPKNFAEAKQVLKAAVNRDNQDPFAWYQLGIIYDREGDPARARWRPRSAATSRASPRWRWPAPQMAMKGIPPGTPDWLRAQDIAMVSKAELAKKDKKYRDEKTSERQQGRRRNVDSDRPSPEASSARLLTAALLTFAAARMISSQIVRQGLLADPQILSDTIDALRDAQYAPVLDANRAAIETPFASSWKGAAKPEVTLVEFFDYACPYCKASNPHVDRLLKEDKGLRVVYRELPILGPDSLTSARLSLEASKLGRFAQFHDALWAAGPPGARDQRAAAQAAGIAPTPKATPQIEAELKRNFRSPASSARPERRCS